MSKIGWDKKIMWKKTLECDIKRIKNFSSFTDVIISYIIKLKFVIRQQLRLKGILKYEFKL
jgi:hypothetical protein